MKNIISLNDRRNKKSIRCFFGFHEWKMTEDPFRKYAKVFELMGGPYAIKMKGWIRYRCVRCGKAASKRWCNF